MTAVTVNGADLAKVLDAALIILDPADVPPEVRRCWHALATTAPHDAVRLLADLDEDAAGALTAPVIDIDRGRRIRLRRLVNDHKNARGIEYPTDVFGLVANLPAERLTDDQRWMLDQLTPAHRDRCAAVWAEYGTQTHRHPS